MTYSNIKDKNRLFLIDTYALIYRAYFAFIKSPRINKNGLNTSAIFGFTNTLLDLIFSEKPSHIVAVFDTSKPTVRHEMYPEYKANREKTPEDITIAIPYIKSIIKALNIPTISCDGYEADDVIGTLAYMASSKGYTTYMVTPDKDFGQLVRDNILIYKPSRMKNEVEILGVNEICKKFEIQTPSQVIDILGLWGDSSDNIPGVPGVGEKTAKQLINDYGSVENIILNADKLKGKLQENVKKFSEQALLSKKLATIITDVPVEFNEEEFELSIPNINEIAVLFEELEFKSLINKLININNNVKEKESISENTTAQNTLFDGLSEVIENERSKVNSIKDINVDYKLLETKEERQNLIKALLSQKEICFDTETTNIDQWKAELVGISFSYKKNEAYYIGLPQSYNEAYNIINEFKQVFEDEKILKIGHNIKYDLTVLRWYDILVKGDLFDTMIAHYLLEPDLRHNMNFLSEMYLNYTPIKIESLIGEKGVKQLNMKDKTPQEVYKYACEDADVTWQLKDVFENEMKKSNTYNLFKEVEMPLLYVLYEIEVEGVKIDKEFLNKYSIELTAEIEKVDKKIIELAGVDFNISSPKQLGEVLFEHLKIDDNAKKTKTKQYSTGEDVLLKLQGKHQIIDEILSHRTLKKLLNTYVDALPELINIRTNKVHTTFNQGIVATGRLSSTNPNLQNIPIKTEKSREIRKAFISRSQNYLFYSADYSQIELRIIADLSKDEGLINAFKNGIDIHTETASKIFHIPIEAVTSDMRRRAKSVNFGIIYGISAFGLSQNLNIPRKESAELINNYFLQYPKVKEYMDNSIVFARENGFVQTILGRRRYLKDINSSNANVRGYAERNAINAPIQGSSADIIKMAMININKTFHENNYKSKMILQVHDELIFDMHISEIEFLDTIVKEKMTNAVKLSVPLVVETGYGKNWFEAH